MIINSLRITVLVVIVVIGVSPIMGQQSSPSKNPPLRIVEYNGDLASLLGYMGQSFGVTIGLEIDPKQLNRAVRISVRDATLSDVLNAIVKSAPEYEWRERNGCIEVMPVAGGNPFLDTMINNFQVNEVDQTEAVNRLLNLLDVQANLRSMSLTRKDPPSASETKIEKFSVKVEGVTVREALSKIANESRRRFWLFRTLGGGFFSVRNSPM